MKKVLLSLLLALFSITAFAVAPNEKKEKNVIQVREHTAQFMLKQASNPTTGYRWSVKYYDQNLLKLVKTWEQPPVSQVVGAPGKTLWVFEALPQAFTKPQTTRIELVYARPWNQEDNPKEVNYLVVIKP